MSLRDQYIRGVDGYLIAYSITSRESFEALSTFYKQIERALDSDSFPGVIVGTKVDLADGFREVSTEEGKSAAGAYNMPFFETSAKEGKNLKEAFEALVLEIRKANPHKVEAGKERQQALDEQKKNRADKKKAKKKSGGCVIM